MDEVTIILVLLGAFVLFLIVKRFNAGTFVANDKMFSQAGVTVDFEKSTVTIKNKVFDVDKITNVRTEPPLRGQTLAFDCVISIQDFGLPEHRVRFLNSTQANKFMQRLCTAIEQAGGPVFR